MTDHSEQFKLKYGISKIMKAGRLTIFFLMVNAQCLESTRSWMIFVKANNRLQFSIIIKSGPSDI